MSLLKILIIALFSALIISAASCKKSREKRSETETTQQNAYAEAMFDDVLKQVNLSIYSQSGIYKNEEELYELFSCPPTITVDPTATSNVFPKTVEIDFGNTNCLGNDNINRRGKITAVLTDRYKNTGSKITITLSEYYVNDNQVQGTKTIENMGLNGNGNMSFNIKVSNASVTMSDGTISWESERTREWVEGLGTIDPRDDVYHITGWAKGKTKKGLNFTATIVEYLVVKLNCRWITKGVLDLIPEDYPTRRINYGDGSCDNKATVTINNRSKEINLN
jgi:hypothetical protein